MEAGKWLNKAEEGAVNKAKSRFHELRLEIKKLNILVHAAAKQHYKLVKAVSEERPSGHRLRAAPVMRIKPPSLPNSIDKAILRNAVLSSHGEVWDALIEKERRRSEANGFTDCRPLSKPFAMNVSKIPDSSSSKKGLKRERQHSNNKREGRGYRNYGASDEPPLMDEKDIGASSARVHDHPERRSRRRSLSQISAFTSEASFSTTGSTGAYREDVLGIKSQEIRRESSDVVSDGDAVQPIACHTALLDSEEMHRPSKRRYGSVTRTADLSSQQNNLLFEKEIIEKSTENLVRSNKESSLAGTLSPPRELTVSLKTSRDSERQGKAAPGYEQSNCSSNAGNFLKGYATNINVSNLDGGVYFHRREASQAYTKENNVMQHLSYHGTSRSTRQTNKNKHLSDSLLPLRNRSSERIVAGRNRSFVSQNKNGPILSSSERYRNRFPYGHSRSRGAAFVEDTSKRKTRDDLQDPAANYGRHKQQLQHRDEEIVKEGNDSAIRSSSQDSEGAWEHLQISSPLTPIE